MISLDDIQAAHGRIAHYVRRTPLIEPAPLREPPCENLSLKLECLQVSGSFKARGASNKLTILDETTVERGLITASGGNHGLGVAYAGWRASAPATIYLPGNTPQAKADKLKKWGADVVFEGEVWDDANRAALKAAERDGLTYVHPFADPAVIAGQGTVGLEILADAPDTDTLVVAIGGGGLISGTATAAKALKPGIKIIGVEPVGAPTLRRSVEAGRLIELSSIDTRANTLAPRRSEQINLDLISQNVDEIVLVDDDAMIRAAQWLWFELGLAVELSAAAGIAALREGAYRPATGERVSVVICGTGTDGLV